MADYLIAAFTLAGIYLIAGSGLFILTGLNRQISIAQASLMGVGAIVAGYLSHSESINSGKGFSFIPSFFIAILLTGLVSALFALITIRLRGATWVLPSIGVSIVILYILKRSSLGTSTVSKNIKIGSTDFSNLTIAGHTFSEEVGLLILVALIVLAAIAYTRNVTRSPMSRAMRCIGDNESAAQTCAVSPLKVVVSAHLVNGFFAGAAGVLYANYIHRFEISSLNPWFVLFGFTMSIQLVLFVVSGGLKSYLATCVAVVAFVVSISLLNSYSKSIEMLSFLDDGRVSAVQIGAICTALVAILFVQISERLDRSKM